MTREDIDEIVEFLKAAQAERARREEPLRNALQTALICLELRKPIPSSLAETIKYEAGKAASNMPRRHLTAAAR